ncbi:cupin domain-containing protein [Yinghuangia sp. YIM S10712]|uniref:cupin domain-containing protein n=1 Tax=Yinghuangia sp. YIM S10712 TaxID=3436930 RepID=UPI003F535514
MTTAAESVVARLGGDFLAQAFGRTYRLVPGDAAQVAGLADWDRLNTVLARHRLEQPRLRLCVGGDMLPQNAYTRPVVTRRITVWHQIQPAALHERLAAGATLVLDAADELDDHIAHLAVALEREFRTTVQVNLYASWTADSGFGVHWDDHDTVVVQVDGAKRWRLFGPTRTAPLHRDVALPDPPPDEPVAEFVLTAGDVLYVPRGWWHDVAAEDGRSLHLTCGLRTTTGADLLAWLSESLLEHPVLRSDVPRFGTAQARDDFAAALRTLLAESLSSGDVVARFAAARDATEKPRLAPSLPHVTDLPADAELRVRLIVARPTLATDPAGRAVLTAGGQEWTFAAPAYALLALLTDGRDHSLAELANASSITVGQAASALGELVRGQVACTSGTAT